MAEDTNTPVSKNDNIAEFIFDSASDGIFVCDSGRLLELNSAACRMFGFERSELIGNAIDALCADNPAYAQREAVAWLKQPRSGAPRIFEWRYKAKNGRLCWAEVSLQYASFGGRDVGLAIARDISRRRTVTRMAHRDMVTGLPNRWDFHLTLREAIARSERCGDPLSVAMGDIDNFKMINDSFGHQVGDIVLKKVAQFMRSRLRRVDYIARWGGEEFTFLLQEAEGEVAEMLQNRLRESIANYLIPDISRAITLSFGVTTYLKSDDPDTLLKRADQALYLSKQVGRNTVTRI